MRVVLLAAAGSLAFVFAAHAEQFPMSGSMTPNPRSALCDAAGSALHLTVASGPSEVSAIALCPKFLSTSIIKLSRPDLRT